MSARDRVCDIVITDAELELKRDFKGLCASEGKTYRDMLRDLVDFYKRNKDRVKCRGDEKP